MFQFPALDSVSPCGEPSRPAGLGVSPFGDPRIVACDAAPRGLSWRATTFFAPSAPEASPVCWLSLSPVKLSRSAGRGANAAVGPRKPYRHGKLPRKEVIQPHLPIRLPCYDFTPITDPTVDGTLRGCGWIARLRVWPTLVV